MTLADAHDDSMAELRVKFLSRARADVVSILELCDRAVDSPRSDAVIGLGEASRLLHRLAGTAGTFGLAELGLQARQLNALARVMVSEPQEEFAERLIGLSDGVKDMARSLDAVMPAPEPSEGKSSDPALQRPSGSPLLCVLGFDTASAARICQAFSGFGYFTRTVRSVAELSDVVAGEDVAAILVKLDQERDEQLAGLNRLRAMQESPAPVIAMCERSDFGDYLAAARAGIDGYFVDPPDLPRIEARVAFLIERRRSESMRVLLVDDDADLLAACKLILRENKMVVETAQEPAGVIELLSEFRPDVVLMDIDMPGCTGPELAQVIRLNEEWVHVPILYMSGQSEGADKLLATRKAGEAFLAKPIDPRELVASICAHGRNARQMIETASRDTLTGLLKGSFIHELLDSELERAQRQGLPTSVAMVDLDFFKSVNDLHGHLVGDLVIRTLAAVFRQRLRLVDGIGRVGGEEFLLVFSGCNAAEAISVLEGVRARFAEIEFDGSDGRFKSSFSAGIGEAGPGESTRTELITLADRALYAAKASGRNCIRIADRT